ncbi:hypothetical protein CI670_016780 [Escherichia coli]|nr:hypothetical protein CI670_016780 [Escherichia coli]
MTYLSDIGCLEIQGASLVPNPLRWIDPLGLNKGASLSKMMNSSSDLMGLRRQPQNFWRLYRGKDI